MSLSKLNHDCFLSVLGQLSTDRKLAFRLVSSEWCTFFEGQLRRQTSLSFFTKPIHHQTTNFPRPRPFDSFSKHKDHTYTVKQLRNSVFATIGHPFYLSTASFNEARFLPLLKRLCPAIRKLSIFHYDQAHCWPEEALRALTTWQATLTSVALNYTPRCQITDSWSNLWFALSALPKLKYLHLENIRASSAAARSFYEKAHLEAIFGRLQILSAAWYIDSDFLTHLGATLRQLSMESELLLCQSQISSWPVCPWVQVLHLLASSRFTFWKPANAGEHLRQVRRVFPQLKAIIYNKNGGFEKKRYLAQLAAQLGVQFLEM